MNKIIQQQLRHRSIRKFEKKAISEEIISGLIEVAQHIATSNYAQSYSILSITDFKKKKAISEIGEQAYIADSAHLFIMLADKARNAAIISSLDGPTEIFSTFDKFFIGATDVILAAQNIMLAAESQGIGGVFLGSVLNDMEKLIEILELPPLVIPVLGIALGYPDQEPQMKPRIPENLIHFKNNYPKNWRHLSDELKDYNATEPKI